MINRLFFEKYKRLTKHLLAWVFTFGILKLLSFVPEWIEIGYSRNIYPVIALINRWFARFFPFSIGDLLYFWGTAYLIYQIIQLLFQIKHPQNQILKISNFLLKTIWIFYLSWGLNYYREPLTGLLHLNDKDYTAQELLQVTDTLINRANNLQLQLIQNDTLAVQIPYSISHIIQMTPQGYRAIEKYLKTSYKLPCIKTSLFSKQISYMQVSGYLNPFTGEAQINRFYPKIFLPDIASHEVAHQLGFAPENEANFLGYLAATHHPDAYFRYSGTIDALYYFLVEIRRYNTDTYKEYLQKINRGILKNYQEAFQFQKAHRFPIDFSKPYDTYLKLNQQKSGIQSYNEMVRLVIAYEIEIGNKK